mgnify:CR=1 FL=1
MKENNTLIVYFSYSGNTEQIVHMIQKQKHCDVLKLEPLVSYTNDYQSLVDEEEHKMNREEVVALKPYELDLSNYSKIVLGTPVWWYTMTPVMRSFLKQTDLTGKEVSAVITNGGWLGHTLEEIKKYTPLTSSINIIFQGHDLGTSQEDISNWISKL